MAKQLTREELLEAARVEGIRGQAMMDQVIAELDSGESQGEFDDFVSEVRELRETDSDAYHRLALMLATFVDGWLHYAEAKDFLRQASKTER